MTTPIRNTSRPISVASVAPPLAVATRTPRPVSERSEIGQHLANLFNQGQSAHYRTSMLRRYLEEALAEANVRARTDARNWLGQAAAFPLTGDDCIALRDVRAGDVVTVGAAVTLGATSAVVDGAIDLGVCAIGDRRFRAELQRIGTPLERQERAEQRQATQSQRALDAMIQAQTKAPRR